MRALVTGAAGFIGSQLCEQLLANGAHVVAIDRQPIPARDRLQVVTGDLCDPEVCAHAADVDVVYHLAGKPGVRQSWTGFDEYLTDNLLATQCLLDAVSDTPLARFVFASSSSVYGEYSSPRPISPYGVTKLAVEALCAAYRETRDVPTVGLRYFTVYGPGQRPDMAFARFIAAIAAGELVDVLGDGRQTRSFTYIQDVVHATMIASDAPPGVYDVAGAERASVLDAIAIIGALCGRDPRIRHLPSAPGDPRHPARFRSADLPGFAATTTLADGLQLQVRATSVPR